MKPFKVAYFSSTDGELYSVIMAKKELGKRYPGLIQLDIFSRYSTGGRMEPFYDSACDSDFILVTLMGGLRTFGNADDFLPEVKRRKIPVHFQTSTINNQDEVKPLCSLPKDHYEIVEKYVLYGGISNYINLFLWLAREYGSLETAYEGPEETPFDGIYHPACGICNTLEDYLAKRPWGDTETVGILFYRAHLIGNNMSYLDALINRVEEQGCNVLPVFIYTTVAAGEAGNLGLEGAIDSFFRKDKKTIVDSVVNSIGFSLTNGTKNTVEEENIHILKKLDVPILKAILTTQSYTEWSGSEKGISLMDYSLNVVLPEYDGQVITYPISTKEKLVEDIFVTEDMYNHHPVEERISRIARMARKYAGLNRKENRDRRVAIIFHNYPPGNGGIGSASGLDTFESVARLLTRMRERGYHLQEIPADGQMLVERLLEFATNERTWVSPGKLEKNGLLYSKDRYREVFEGFPEQNRLQMRARWGETPGDVLIYKDNIIIPGMINGNVFIGMQPARGWGDDPSQIYHSPDLPPTHQYLAFYSWIREEFKADAVIHVGTHGNLEWLPGKSVGLSRICYPDLAIADLPHFYYYTIKNPGEGTQAKRRSYAVIVDHMIPPLHAVEGYEELESIETKINLYYESKLTDEAKLPVIRKQIWDQVKANNLDKDINYTEEEAFFDYDGFLETLHGYINEVKHTQIKEGMHVLGRVPEGEELVNLVLAITRISNGDIPSLLESVAKAKGYDPDIILENRGKLVPEEKKTYGQILDGLQQTAKAIITAFYQTGFDTEKIEEISCRYLGESNEQVKRVLAFIAADLYPRLRQTSGEITNLLDGLEGKFILPGPCGNISRGGAHLLPTGRNFYTLDPDTIPSKAAWEVGKRLGDALLKSYREEEGRFPESIGMIIWGTPTLRSKGDDIAEVLYLLGLEPVWDIATGKVRGLKIVPPDELGHPRIDVTLRISGLFRDTFPSVINLLDEAFNLVAGLDEPGERNYVAKHVREEAAERIQAGGSPDPAGQTAVCRIFGCKPGTYGTGVNHAVETREWKDDRDLADIYLNWGSYVYTKEKKGEFNRELFKKRLEKIEATVQNTTSRETDILDADDFYHYHGGFANAVRIVKGNVPRTYCGDSSDPGRVKVRSAEKELKYVYRSRILNPRWIESMKRHGYKGAADIAKAVEYSFGWDATARLMDDWMYEELAKKFALDKGFAGWAKEVNPWALQDITERLLEAIQRGMWSAVKETEEQLKKLYLEMEGELETYVDET